MVVLTSASRFEQRAQEAEGTRTDAVESVLLLAARSTVVTQESVQSLVRSSSGNKVVIEGKNMLPSGLGFLVLSLPAC